MSNEKLLQSTSVNEGLVVSWSGDGKFIETLEIKALEKQPDLISIIVKTQFLTAKNPSEMRVKSQIFFTT